MKRSYDVVRFHSAVVIAALWICVLGAQSVHAGRWMVPASANVAGNAGTNWRTDLRLVNLENSAASVRIYLLRAGMDNSALDRFVDVTVPAGGQAQINNILASKFSFSGTAALGIDAEDIDLLVTSRTYNQVPQGTYGQFIPGVRLDHALIAGSTGYLVYLAKSADFRTNLGWAGTSPESGQIVVTVYDAGGAPLGTETFNIVPFVQQQINDIFSAVGAPATPNAYATVTATVPVVAYASVVDNRTGDPVAVLAQPAPVAPADLLLSGVARAAGVGTSLWRTDLRIFGAGADGGAVTLAYHPKNTAVTNPTSVPLAIAPGQLLALDDVMLSAFGMDSANGGLRITADVPLIVSARTYNQSPGGTYGQAIPAVSLGELIRAGDQALLSGVQGGDFRSNALFFNAGDTTTELNLELIRGDGTVVGTRTMTLKAGEIDQINNVIGFFGLAKSNGPHTLKASAEAGGPYSAALSVIDGGSDDPSYENARRSFAGDDGDCIDMNLPRIGTTVTYDWGGFMGDIFGGERFEGEMVKMHLAGGSDGIHELTIVTFQFEGIEVSFTTDTIDIYSILTTPEGHAELTRSYTEQYGTTGGFPRPLITYDNTYSPPLYVGPLLRWCERESWSVPSVMETVVSDPGGTTTEPTLSAAGRVISVNETITTPAGTFSVVHSIVGRNWSGYGFRTAIQQWISTERGVLIKQIFYNLDGIGILNGIEAKSID